MPRRQAATGSLANELFKEHLSRRLLYTNPTGQVLLEEFVRKRACSRLKEHLSRRLLYTNPDVGECMRLDVNRLSSAVRLALPLGAVATAGAITAQAQTAGAAADQQKS